MIEIITALERARLETESGRADVEKLNNPSDFYYKLKEKGVDCIKTLEFLAEYLPEKYQSKLFNSDNIMHLIKTVLFVGSEYDKDGTRYVSTKGTPLKEGTKATIPLELDKDGIKEWNSRKKRIRKILSEIIGFMDDKPTIEELSREYIDALREIDRFDTKMLGIRTIKLLDILERGKK